MSKRKKNIPLPQLSPNIFVVDTHCHLDMAAYDDCRLVVQESLAAGVKYILTVGIDLASSKAAVTLADEFPGVYCSVGIHPHHVVGVEESEYREIAALARHPKVKAYGEIGLDYARDYAPHDVQIKHFERQIALAKELSLPLIIHDREAHDDVMAILKAALPMPAGGVMHCYSGDMQLAEAAIDLGFLLSIPGVVTFSKAEMMHEVARNAPLSSLLIETDGPYLAPEPFRGKRNEPAYVLYTAAKVAELRGVSIDEVARQTSANAMRLFAIREASS
ncbi:MAG: TatD family hydrolase [Desulfobulbaceae bacterium]|nr:TatD family hydrolase [Desulfobulbaceae bacterium]